MHEFEFEVRISDQIQTVKMQNGSWAKFEIYSNIVSLRLIKISATRCLKITAHVYAKFEVLTRPNSRKTDAALSGPSEGNACACSTQQYWGGPGEANVLTVLSAASGYSLDARTSPTSRLRRRETYTASQCRRTHPSTRTWSPSGHAGRTLFR